MTMYCFSQQKGGEARWVAALASERERIVANERPEFITVLDVDNSFEQDLSLLELLAVKYLAPYGFYVDFDSADIGEALDNARLFAVKLQSEYGFELEQARYFFSGGKGVHIEIPMSAFMQKIPQQGIVGLPYIFRELALALYVDTLDMRVYSGKRGRMWRVPNVRRSNGKYKVQVTAHEMMTSDAQQYALLVSDPRALMPVAPASFNPKLAYAYAAAVEKYLRESKKRAKSKEDSRELERFKGEWPDSVMAIMHGEGVRPDAGWNQIVIQLGTVAQALGKSEDDLVEASTELIGAHRGDSGRYASAHKREREMRNMFRYLDGNPAYTFSLGGLFSIFARDAYRGDLEAGDYDPTAEDDGADDVAGPADESSERAFCKISGHIKWGKNGLYVKVEDTFKLVSNLGMSSPTQLMKLEGGEALGYELDLHVGNGAVHNAFVTMNTFNSRQSMNTWASKYSMSVQAPDSAVSAIVDLLRIRTQRNKKVVYTVSREGLDLVALPGIQSEDEYQLIYATPQRVWGGGEASFRFRGMHDQGGAFKSDLLNAPVLEDTPEMREFLDNLFQINSAENVGKMFGWFVAAFLCQPLRRAARQFPMLQVYGQAGAGKTKTVELFNALHYFMAPPKKLSAAGNTQFPIIAAVTQSASMPVVFEEFKPRELPRYQKDILTNIFRNNYDGSRIERGGLSRDAGTKEIVINGFDNVAPIAFLGEALETQTAIIERCVVASLSKQSRQGRSRQFKYCHDRIHMMGSIGHTLVRDAMTLRFSALRENLAAYNELFRVELGDDAFEGMERPLYNLAVVALSLDFLSLTLSKVFADRYTERVQELKCGVLDSLATTMPDIMDECSKVLDVMGQLTRVQDVQYRLERNQDYTWNGVDVELKLRTAFAKYVRYQRSLDMDVLYDNDRAFQAALQKYGGTVATRCPTSSPLYHNPFEPIFRISGEYLSRLGVEPFQPLGDRVAPDATEATEPTEPAKS